MLGYDVTYALDEDMQPDFNTVDAFFKKHKDNVNYVLNMVKENNPKYIGFSSFVTDYNVVLLTLKGILIVV